MFARITEYKMKPGTRDQATALLNDLKPQIMAMDGMRSFINVMNDDGSGYVVSLVTDEETSDANADKVAALWANFSEMLERPPERAGFDVIAAWNNG